MKKDDLIILLIGLLLLTGMLITIFFGGERSLHGVGMLFDGQPKQYSPGDRFQGDRGQICRSTKQTTIIG